MTTREPRKQIFRAENGEACEDEEKWIAHYSSNHQILLVGEGDFSFSLSLANAFASASNICASSLDSYDVLVKKYKHALSNLDKLTKLGASLLHEVDATKMKHHIGLAGRKFDRIIFNFPHAGFYGKESNARMIRMHKNLVQGFFRSASSMLRSNGEIHVNHKTSSPFCLWNLEELASGSSLALIRRVDFNVRDYQGYQNKRGDGSRCDEPFPLGESSTFKFSFRRRAGVSEATKRRGSRRRKSRHFQTIHMPLRLQATSGFNYPRITRIVNHVPEHDRLRLIIPNGNHYSRVLDRNGLVRTYPRNSYGVAHPERLMSDFDARCDVLGRVRHEFDRQRVEVPRTSYGNLYNKHENKRMRRNSIDGKMLEVPRISNSNLYYKHEHEHEHERVRRRLDGQILEVPRTSNSNLYYKHGHEHEHERARHSLGRQMVKVPRTSSGSLHYTQEHELYNIGNSRLHLRRPVASMLKTMLRPNMAISCELIIIPMPLAKYGSAPLPPEASGSDDRTEHAWIIMEGGQSIETTNA